MTAGVRKQSRMAEKRFPKFAWGVLFYNIGVILWGAYVRASGSGAGCGAHWPSCPHASTFEWLVELSHRATSGLSLALAAVLLVWALRAFPARHIVRRGALLAVLFTCSEAIVGAALVLFKLVAHNTSLYRAVAIAAHLSNTFLLLAALALTAWWASGGAAPRMRGQGPLVWALGLGLLALAVLGASGAITALGDTLYPMSLSQGLKADFSPATSPLLRMRLPHPLIAMSVGFYLLFIAGYAAHSRPARDTYRFSGWIRNLFLAQIGVGCLNVILLAPIWMQFIHLLMADATWIVAVLLTASALSVEAPGPAVVRRPSSVVSHQSAGGNPQAAGVRAGWRDYLALTKPRVISLLLFTTLAAMIIAKRGWPGTWLFLAVAVGGYMAAGAANAINMVVDRDIDGRMKRTTKRPTVTHLISGPQAMLFALALEAGSFVILWRAANVLCALLALAGLLFYVFIYTLLLKRRTWHNIVIGGAAGAFPPLVGWAAVTDDLSLLAWYLFAIIFVWTPVHFWALALLIKDDYAEAGIPMLPVVRGERITVLQIAVYAVLTALISVLPLFLRQVGSLYLVAAVLLNLVLLWRSLQLYQEPDRPHAKTLFKYSMVYLALLFLVMAVDRSMGL